MDNITKEAPKDLQQKEILINDKLPDKRGNIIVILGIAITAFVLMAGAVFLFTKESQKRIPIQNSVSQPSTHPQTTTTNTSDQWFPEKQFDTQTKINDGEFKNELYPFTLQNINDNELVGMKCTQHYSDSVYGPADPEFFLTGKYDNKPQDVITDQQKKELIQTIKLGNSHLSGTQFCKTEDNRTVWNYETGYGTSSFIAYLNIQAPDGNNALVTKIPTDGNFWFSCNKPLMLTKSGTLYYQCGGGNNNVVNPSFSESIYTVDLNSKTNKIIYTCTSIPRGDKTQDRTISCKSL